MPEEVTPVTPEQLIEQAKASIRGHYPDDHIRKAALDHLDHSAAWLKELDKLKARRAG